MNRQAQLQGIPRGGLAWSLFLVLITAIGGYIISDQPEEEVAAKESRQNQAATFRQQRRDEAERARRLSKLSLARIETNCTIAFVITAKGLFPAFSLNRGMPAYRVDGSDLNKGETACAKDGTTAEFVGAPDTTWVNWGKASGEQHRKQYTNDYDQLLDEVLGNGRDSE